MFLKLVVVYHHILKDTFARFWTLTLNHGVLCHMIPTFVSMFSLKVRRMADETGLDFSDQIGALEHKYEQVKHTVLVSFSKFQWTSKDHLVFLWI